MTLLTEDEAKTKWCPLARAPGTMITPDETGQDKRIGVTQNRGYQMGGALSNCMCIASKCMAWRTGRQIGIGPNGEKRTRDMDGRTRWVDTGYCGAFGRVEP